LETYKRELINVATKLKKNGLVQEGVNKGASLCGLVMMRS